MSVVLLPLAAYLLLYAPGHYLLRGDRPPGTPRLLREVLLSAGGTSWVGFVLAEVGWFSLPALLTAMAGIAVAAAWWQRGAPPGRYTRRDAVGCGVFLAACLWIAPPLDTRLSSGDSAGYLASGVQVARHGSLVLHDPTLAHISVDLKRAVFPSVAPERGRPPYLRVSGSLMLRNLDSDEVLPAFHHLIAVWVAVAHAVGGLEAGPWVITLFGGLSVWAIVECAAVLGAGTGWVLPLLLLSAIQYWYGRFLMPEVPGQFFVWAGVACVAIHERSGRAADAGLGGLAFGMAGLMRTENAFFLAAALGVLVLVAPRGARGRYALLFAVAAVVWVHAAIHLAVFRTHYWGILRSMAADGMAMLATHGVRLAAALIAGAVLMGLWRWAGRRRGAWSPSLDHALVAGLLAAAAWAGARGQGASLDLLVTCVGIPTLLGGGAGVLLLLRAGDAPAMARRLVVLLAALVFAQVMIEPHAQPVPIWTARRSLPVILPALCIGVALVCSRLARRWHWTLAVAALCGGLAGQAQLFWTLRSDRYAYRGATRHVQALAALMPPGATVLYDAQLVASGLMPALWAQRDLPAYLFADADTERITELVTALGDMPVYWVTTAMQPLPRLPGIELLPAALYDFVLTTPKLDPGTPIGATANWQMSVALYRLRVTS